MLAAGFVLVLLRVRMTWRAPRTVVAAKRILCRGKWLAVLLVSILGHCLSLMQFSVPLQLSSFQKVKVNVPLKRGKHNGGNHDIAHIPITQYQIMVENGQRDEAGKPEQHGQGVNTQDGELVCQAREVERGEGEVGDGDEQGPNGGEDEEADAVGGIVDAGAAIVPVCDWVPRLVWGFLERTRETNDSQ